MKYIKCTPEQCLVNVTVLIGAEFKHSRTDNNDEAHSERLKTTIKKLSVDQNK